MARSSSRSSSARSSSTCQTVTTTTKPDFAIAAANAVSQDPQKLRRLMNGFTHLDLQHIPGFGTTWFLAPDQLSITSRPDTLKMEPRLSIKASPPSNHEMHPNDLDTPPSLVASEDEDAPSSVQDGDKSKKRRNKKKGKAKKTGAEQDSPNAQSIECQVEDVTYEVDDEGAGMTDDEREADALIDVKHTPQSDAPDPDSSDNAHEANITVSSPPLAGHRDEEEVMIDSTSIHNSNTHVPAALDSSEEDINEQIDTPGPHEIHTFDSGLSPEPQLMLSPVTPPSPECIDLVIPTIKIFAPSHTPIITPVSSPVTHPPQLSLEERQVHGSHQHPLARAWTLYFSDTSDKARLARKVSGSVLNPGRDATSKAEDYSCGLVTLFTSATVDDIIGSWKALRRGIANAKGRIIEPEGIKPMWEDPKCAKGGKIMLAGESAAVMDHVFLEICLLLIGGTMEDACPPPASSNSMVCGAVISRRKLTRIEIWLGGDDRPDPAWIKAVTEHFERKFPTFRVYGYKSFGK